MPVPSADPDRILRALVDRWCERRELVPLARLLPALVWNFGMTDGWGDLRKAVRRSG